MVACPTIETARLTLRPFHEGDLDAYFAVLDTAPVRAALHTPDTFDRAGAWGQMAMWLGQWALRGTGQWALVERETDRLVGRAGLHRPERPGWPGIEVGWALHPDHWGRGFATEAGQAAVDYGFEELGLDQLCSVILPENASSQAVARRLGFELREERVLSHFPDQPHGIWWKTRPLPEPVG